MRDVRVYADASMHACMYGSVTSCYLEVLRPEGRCLVLAQHTPLELLAALHLYACMRMCKCMCIIGLHALLELCIS